MELNQKLQQLRQVSGLTQEELAEKLYVSRTAISKWESGRGYPSIESLKAISVFFGVTIDELLSPNEALTIAEKDGLQKARHFRGLVFGLLDTSALLFLFLPLFRQSADGTARAASLFMAQDMASYLKTAYLTLIACMVLCGIWALALPSGRWCWWDRHKSLISLLVHTAGVLLFIISPQPYAAAFLFFFLLIKGFLLLKHP